MARERWGGFSVIDHKNTAAYVPEVLLYDRLVIPVPPKDNRVGKVEPFGWKPDLLRDRLETLKRIAVTVEWNSDHQEMFQRRMNYINDVRWAANAITKKVQYALPCQMTSAYL